MFLYKNIIYLHAPKTGGVAFTNAAKDKGAILVNQDPRINHISYKIALEIFGNKYKYISVIRSPWEVMASLYAMFQDRLKYGTENWWWHVGHPLTLKEMVNLPFEQFIEGTVNQQHFRPIGGFSILYKTEYSYKYHLNVYEEICKDFKLNFDIKREHSFGPHPTWTQKAIDLVAKYDFMDIELFNFEPPKCES